MLNFFLVIFSSLFLFEAEIGELAFVVTFLAIAVAVIFKVIKNRRLHNGTS